MLLMGTSCHTLGMLSHVSAVCAHAAVTGHAFTRRLEDVTVSRALQLQTCDDGLGVPGAEVVNMVHGLIQAPHNL